MSKRIFNSYSNASNEDNVPLVNIIFLGLSYLISINAADDSIHINYITTF